MSVGVSVAAGELGCGSPRQVGNQWHDACMADRRSRFDRIESDQRWFDDQCWFDDQFDDQYCLKDHDWFYDQCSLEDQDWLI